MGKIKLQAFTVMELMVALVLTAVVVSTGFFAMRRMAAQSGELDAHNRRADAASRLQAVLRTDARRAEAMRATDVGLQFDMVGGLTIVYEAADSTITRIGPADQTVFELTPDSISYTFRGGNTAIGGVADQALIWCKQAAQLYSFTVVKNYDAETLMRLTDEEDGWN